MRTQGPPRPPPTGAPPEDRFDWWRQLLQAGPGEEAILRWVADLQAARDGMRSAYRAHADGLSGLDRRDARRSLRARFASGRWVVEVADGSGQVVESVVVHTCDDALSVFFALHDTRVRPVRESVSESPSATGFRG